MAKSIGSYFGTLLESVTQAHRDHLMTGKFSDHKGLNDFYDDAPDAVDSIVETYQGIHGKVKLEDSELKSTGNPIKYFEELKKYTEEGREALVDKKDTEVWSDIDSFLSLVDQTLYKLKELKENRSLYENMKEIKTLSQYISEKCSGKSCNEDEKKMKSCPLCEEDVTDEKSFREYAMQVLKEMHKDDFDEKKAKETVDGILKDHADAVEDGDWGELIGILNKGTK